MQQGRATVAEGASGGDSGGVVVSIDIAAITDPKVDWLVPGGVGAPITYDLVVTNPDSQRAENEFTV